MLEKCSKAVERQEIVIEHQKKLIDGQKLVIKTVEAEVERSHKATRKVAVGGISVSSLLLLLLLL